jgi:hypothetical protein
MPKVKEKTDAPIETTLVPAASFATMPATTQDAIRVAELIAGSDLAPACYKGKPGNTYIAMQMGGEIGLSPMKSIQSIAVINGKPCLYGDVGKALLLKHGCRIEERDVKEIKKLGEGCCKITRPDGSKPIIRTFSIDDAKEASLWGKAGPWTQYPYRMLAWRAFWFAARDAGADFLGGLAGSEEVRDYVDTTGEVTPEVEIPAPQRTSESAPEAAPGETVNTETGEVTEPPAARKKNPAWVLIKAKREGPCESCADEVMIGDSVFWDKTAGKVHHAGHFA